MKTASECRKYAAECRVLATHLGEDRRRAALKMAEIWERLASEREGAAHDRKMVRTAGMLKATYDQIAGEPVPDKFFRLLDELQAAERRMRRRRVGKRRYTKLSAAGVDDPTRERN